jgi:hypothetical protein
MTIPNLINAMEGKGWCTLEKATRLHELVVEAQPQVTVELGVFYGKSLFALAQGHKDNEKGYVLGIDPWSNKACLEGSNSPENDKWWNSLNLSDIYKDCISNIEKFKLTDYCTVVRIKSQAVACLIGNDSVDILHQDSNHNVETIHSELKLWMPKLKKGGYWIADDTDWKEALEAYSVLPEYGLELFDNYVRWQIWRKAK